MSFRIIQGSPDALAARMEKFTPSNPVERDACWEGSI